MRGRDVTGQTFGRLTALHRAARTSRRTKWTCRCECGAVGDFVLDNLHIGNTTSCGCRNTEARRARTLKHGQEGSKIYQCWMSMKMRCTNKRDHTYPHYGGRGIKVCREWLSFENFFRDMGAMPAGYSIERVDPNGHYRPDNCKWIPRSLQARNTRRAIRVTWGNQTKLLIEWCEDLGVSYKIVRQRILRDGLDPVAALTKPITRSRRRT